MKKGRLNRLLTTMLSLSLVLLLSSKSAFAFEVEIVDVDFGWNFVIYDDEGWAEDGDKVIVVEKKAEEETLSEAELTTKDATDKVAIDEPINEEVATQEISSFGMNTNLAWQTFIAMNRIRLASGLEPFAWHSQVIPGAQVRATEMAHAGILSHTRPNGSCTFTALQGDLNWGSIKAANGAVGQTCAQSVIAAWQSSPGHWENIMNPNLRFTGLGVYGVWWYQFFINGPAIGAIEVGGPAGGWQLTQGSCVENLNLVILPSDSYLWNLPILAPMVSGFDPNQVGVQELTVSFHGQVASFSVEVVATTGSGGNDTGASGGDEETNNGGLGGNDAGSQEGSEAGGTEGGGTGDGGSTSGNNDNNGQSSSGSNPSNSSGRTSPQTGDNPMFPVYALLAVLSLLLVGTCTMAFTGKAKKNK
jgi:uncharacterized protein YkwD